MSPSNTFASILLCRVFLIKSAYCYLVVVVVLFSLIEMVTMKYLWCLTNGQKYSLKIDTSIHNLTSDCCRATNSNHFLLGTIFQYLVRKYIKMAAKNSHFKKNLESKRSDLEYL